MEDLVNALLQGDQTKIADEFNTQLIRRIGIRMEDKKREVASTMFQTEDVSGKDETGMLLLQLSDIEPLYKGALKCKTSDELKDFATKNASQFADKVNLKKVDWKKAFGDFRDGE